MRKTKHTSDGFSRLTQPLAGRKKRLELRFCQFPIFSLCKVCIEHNRSHRQAFQPLYMSAQSRNHTLYLMVLSFLQNNLHRGQPCCVCFRNRKLCRTAYGAIAQKHALRKLFLCVSASFPETSAR